MKIYFILFLINFSLSLERGKIVSYELIESSTKEEMQIEFQGDVSQFGIVAKYGGSIYKVIYETIDGYGDSTVASGVIGIPNSEDEAFGILSWQHGTQIYRDGVLSNSGFDILSRIVVASGYIFVSADFLGLGISNDIHPYIIKNPSASIVIDLIRATRNHFLNIDGIQLNRQLSIFGYSEGGYATLAIQKEMEENLADEFDIMVSFPMAGPYDLSGVMLDKMLDGEYYGEPFYLPFLMQAYIEYYNLGTYYDFFVPEFANDIPSLFSGDYSGGYINDYMNTQNYNPPILSVRPDVVEDLNTDENYFFRELLRENDLFDWTPQSNTFLFHGTADHLIPYENSVVAYDNFIENGAESVYLELLDDSYGNHQEAAPYAIFAAYGIIESMKLINQMGDVTHDGLVNITDVTTIVNIIFCQVEFDNYSSWASDLDSDGLINIIDILNLVQLILE
tara:strand:- start:1753 stop:3102 length:1350 start_codon:yes stop_codon:yes gene_type:complete